MLGGCGRRCGRLRCRLSLKRATGIIRRGGGGICGRCRLGGGDPSRKWNRKDTSNVSSMSCLENKGGNLRTGWKVTGHRGRSGR